MKSKLWRLHADAKQREYAALASQQWDEAMRQLYRRSRLFEVLMGLEPQSFKVSSEPICL